LIDSCGPARLPLPKLSETGLDFHLSVDIDGVVLAGRAPALGSPLLRLDDCFGTVQIQAGVKALQHAGATRGCKIGPESQPLPGFALGTAPAWTRDSLHSLFGSTVDSLSLSLGLLGVGFKDGFVVQHLMGPRSLPGQAGLPRGISL
jgi:hypothetical protein